MRRIPEKEFGQYISWAQRNTANRVYPLSAAEGIQTGEIFVNDGPETEAVLFRHYCGFGYISGKASEEFLEEVFRRMTSGTEKKRLLLITNDKEIIDFFKAKDVKITAREEYCYHPEGKIPVSDDIAGFRIERISRENIGKLKGRIIPSFSWESGEQFLKNGFGFAAMKDDQPCACAFSSAVSSEEIDIGVETVEECRRMGLAAVLADRMCREIIRTGKRPVWAHGSANAGSKRTALKCGFIKEMTNTVIQKK